MSAGRSHTEIRLESTHSTLITKLRLENQCLSLRLQDERKAYTMQTRLWHRELVATQRVVGTVRGEVLDMKRIMLNGHKTLKRRWHDAQSDVVKWQNIAEQALKEKKVLGEDIRCLGEKFDIAQMSVVYNKKKYLDAEVELKTYKHAAAVTEKAVILDCSNRYAALLRELEDLKMESVRARKTTSDVRQELLALRQQLAILTIERNQAVNQAIHLKNNTSFKRYVKCVLEVLTVAQERWWDRSGKLTRFESVRGAAPGVVIKNRSVQRTAAKRGAISQSNILENRRTEECSKEDGDAGLVCDAKTGNENPPSMVTMSPNVAMIRKLQAAHKTKQQLTFIVKSLTNRCAYLHHQLRNLTCMEEHWREERLLLRSSAQIAGLAIDTRKG